MPRSKPNQEIEVKLRVPDVRELRLKLKQLRAREIIPRTQESNTLYDTPTRDLTRRGKLIRIRTERLGSNGGERRSGRRHNAVLTFKGPSRSLRAPKTSGRERNIRRRLKIRDEVEVVIEGVEQMSVILRNLGLTPTFRYEKFRTTYALPDIRGLKVEFDETPIGLFLELEGNATAIDRAARLLGYSPDDYMTSTYGVLYLADCRRRGRKPSHMVFLEK